MEVTRKTPKMTKAKIHCRAMILMSNWRRARAGKQNQHTILSYPTIETTLTQRKETETITQNIILSHDDIEQTHQQNHPDKDIGKDTAGQIMAMHGDRAVPEERCEGPGIGSGDGGKVYEGREAAVAPVGDGLVDKVDDEDDLGAPEVAAGPEENPGEHEQVVQDEVRGDVGGGGDQDGFLGEEVPDVA